MNRQGTLASLLLLAMAACGCMGTGADNRDGWPVTFGCEDSDSGLAIAVDASDNIYFAGYTRGTGIQSGPSMRRCDVFLSRYDSDGVLLWTRTWGSETSWDTPSGVVVDDAGNVYVAGMFGGSVDFDPGPGAEIRSSQGDKDVFLSKFGPDGDFQWARTWGGELADECTGIGINQPGIVFVTGSFFSEIDFDPLGAGDLRSIEENQGAFLMALNTDGAMQWAHTWGGDEQYNWMRADGISIDPDDNLYVFGSYSSFVEFDPDAESESMTGSQRESGKYLSKFDSTGALEWTDQWRNTPIAHIKWVGSDESGVYLTGTFTGSVDFDPGTVEDMHRSDGLGNVFVLKLGPDGKHLWTQTWGTGMPEYCGGLAVDERGIVYLTGWYNDDVDFDPGPEIEQRSPVGETDVYVSALDPNGGFLWVRTWGGLARDFGKSVILDGSGDLILAGYFRDKVDFDPGPSVAVRTSEGESDAFLVKLTPDGDLVRIEAE